MADERRTQHLPRARAVAELRLEPLLARADEMAQRWAIALILARPLDELGALPLEEIARAAPALCAQALRAVQSDVELERLAVPGASGGREQAVAARGLAGVCGTRDPAALVEAVEALRGVLWEALLDDLSEPSARLLADVGDRLAHVCAAMLAVGVETLAPGAGASAGGSAGESGLEPAPHAPLAHDVASVSTPRGEVVIVDERVSAEVPPLPPVRPVPPVMPVRPTQASRAGEYARPWGDPGTLPDEPSAEIEIRDERREEGPAAWISSIGEQLARFERDGAPFAVLLVELVDIERLRRQGPPEDLMRLASALQRALAEGLESSGGSLARERPGRCWLLVPGSDRAGAERLARQLMRELSAGAGEPRAPLAVAIGTAACPEDGREPAALAAHADIGLYAARSALRASLARASAQLDEPK